MVSGIGSPRFDKTSINRRPTVTQLATNLALVLSRSERDVPRKAKKRSEEWLIQVVSGLRAFLAQGVGDRLGDCVHWCRPDVMFNVSDFWTAFSLL